MTVRALSRVTEKRNSIFITRTAAGYCLTYKDIEDAQLDGYLTPRDQGHLDQAGYVSFPEAIEVVACLKGALYARGVDVNIDPDAQVSIPADEIKSFRTVVCSLEKMAKLVGRGRRLAAEVYGALQNYNPEF